MFFGALGCVCSPLPHPQPICGFLVLPVALCPPTLRRVTRARLLSASKCHMSPNFAENRKPRKLEGSPVIHQGMTIQLFVPMLCGGVTVQGNFLVCLPFPGRPGGAERAWTLSYHLWRRHGQTRSRPSFYLSSLAFLGWGG